jgi:hypothetical protein
MIFGKKTGFGKIISKLYLCQNPKIFSMHGYTHPKEWQHNLANILCPECNV